MSNDEFPPPGEPRDIPGLPNNPVEGAPTEPTQVFPTLPPAAGTPPPPGAPQPGGPEDPNLPPGPPPGAELPYIATLDDPTPWYRQPGQLALVLFGVLAVVGLIILLIVLSGGDDDDEVLGEIDAPVSLVVSRLDASGAARDSTITAVVSSPTAITADYVWIVPADAVPGQPAIRQTDAGGRAQFRWEPTAGLDAADWATTVELGEPVDPAIAEAGVTAACTVDRGADSSPSDLTVDISFSGADSDSLRIMTVRFPNVEFRSGNRIDCTLTDNGPGVDTTTTVPDTTTTTTTADTTTVPETTTTAPETTTTTTVPETTTTTSTTTTSTTTTSTTTTSTTTTTTVPPPVAGSPLAVLVSQPELSGFVQLIDLAGLRSEFDDPTRVVTIFAPDDDAITALIDDPDGPDLANAGIARDLVRAHVLSGEAIDAAEVVTRTSIDMQFGGPQPVDADATPPTLGGAGIIDTDLASANGFIHVIDTVLEPT